MSNDAKPDLLFHWLARVLCQLTDAATVAGEFWVFAEKKASSPQAGFKSGDTIRIEVDMDLNTVVFLRDGDELCAAGNLDGNVRPMVALGNADALVSLQ